jgi:hypothetical protein
MKIRNGDAATGERTVVDEEGSILESESLDTLDKNELEPL